MQTGVPSTNASQSTLFINEIMSPTLDMLKSILIFKSSAFISQKQ